ARWRVRRVRYVASAVPHVTGDPAGALASTTHDPSASCNGTSDWAAATRAFESIPESARAAANCILASFLSLKAGFPLLSSQRSGLRSHATVSPNAASGTRAPAAN